MRCWNVVDDGVGSRRAAHGWLPLPRVGPNEQFIPLLVYRTGPYAPSGIPTANGYIDYLKLLNARDGGINGVKVSVGRVRDQIRHQDRRRVL